ncbi:TIGR02301 family protein [Pararhizobium mangrovi]|uniref:TIGR02301 family protein n=1 Tax=Pararhizobium mangrovi TaxID=2590452 RepID=A0A506UC62_9HYPH|nr:TIGR02301 family protein [Pararhizobium mangrovi]TPW32013.1 TIGR02301 family protein [Pararhizobium mangrovi]
MRIRPALHSLTSVLFVFVLAVAVPGTGRAADAPETPAPAPSGPAAPPYEAQLIQLSRILGSVDYLRDLCKSDDDTDWRDTMQNLIDSEAAGNKERTRTLTAAFNRGYRAFAAVYSTCTQAAVSAEKEYRQRGATIARGIAGKYGN